MCIPLIYIDYLGHLLNFYIAHENGKMYTPWNGTLGSSIQQKLFTNEDVMFTRAIKDNLMIIHSIGK